LQWNKVSSRKRISNLEWKETAMSQEVLYDVFEAMKVSDDDCQLIDAISDRVEPLVACTPEEESAAERFFSRVRKAYWLVSSWQRAVEPRQVTYRYVRYRFLAMT
jgi:hypothetical protein